MYVCTCNFACIVNSKYEIIYYSGKGEAIISKGEEDPARSTDESAEGKEKGKH